MGLPGSGTYQYILVSADNALPATKHLSIVLITILRSLIPPKSLRSEIHALWFMWDDIKILGHSVCSFVCTCISVCSVCMWWDDIKNLTLSHIKILRVSYVLTHHDDSTKVGFNRAYGRQCKIHATLDHKLLAFICTG